MRQRNKSLVMIWIFLMLILMLPWTVQRGVMGAERGNGSLTIRLKDLGTDKKGVKFSIYSVGGLDDSGEWVLNDSLTDTGVSLKDLEYADEWDVAALKLGQKVRERELDTWSGGTDASGEMVLSDLPYGIYLVLQEGEAAYGIVSPFFAGIPFTEDGVQKSDLTVYPKSEVAPKQKNGRIEVTKRISHVDTELMEVVDVMAEDAVYYVGIFKDMQGKVPYGTDYLRQIHIQNASSGTAVYENLPKGTYYVFETDSNGNPVPVDELQEDGIAAWICKLEEGSSQTITLDGKDEAPEGRIGFNNLYYDLPDGYYYAGKINIEKKVIVDGEQTTVPDTFYAGIFRDKEGTDLYKTVQLEQNGMVTVEVPLGGEKGDSPVTYYVYETDQEGIRVDQSTFDYTVSGEGSVKVEKGKLEKTVSLTNTLESESESETELETEPETEPDTRKQTESEPATEPPQNPTPTGSGVRTGDDTPIVFYMIALMAAFLVLLAGAVYMRRRKKHEK